MELPLDQAADTHSNINARPLRCLLRKLKGTQWCGCILSDPVSRETDSKDKLWPRWAPLGRNVMFEQHPFQTEHHSSTHLQPSLLAHHSAPSSQVHNHQELVKSMEILATSERWKTVIIYHNKWKPDTFNQIWVPAWGFLHRREMFPEIWLLFTVTSHSRKNRTTAYTALPSSVSHCRSLTWMLITYMLPAHSGSLQKAVMKSMLPLFKSCWNWTQY